ncbi:50S ribosomal protein P1 [Candidatus Woesearchaeota archaeon]|nr:50S ribosomal protein P1 [Candidatus Woesearchaeota archaeon]|tara:strand:- start:734 stop:1057 length:324 start_codon:yes stop_codon:yes gene_type:complete
MEYVYAAMLLHKAGQKVEEASLTKVVEAAGVKTDPARIKALIAALDGVDIDKAIKDASQVQVAAAPAAAAEGGGEDPAKKAEETKKKEEDSKKGEQQAAAGLSALFG